MVSDKIKEIEFSLKRLFYVNIISTELMLDITMNALEKIKDCPMSQDEMVAEARHAIYCVVNKTSPSDYTKSKFNLFR